MRYITQHTDARTPLSEYERRWEVLALTSCLYLGPIAGGAFAVVILQELSRKIPKTQSNLFFSKKETTVRQDGIQTEETLKQAQLQKLLSAC